MAKPLSILEVCEEFPRHSEQSEESIPKPILNLKDSSVTSFPQNDDCSLCHCEVAKPLSILDVGEEFSRHSEQSEESIVKSISNVKDSSVTSFPQKNKSWIASCKALAMTNNGFTFAEFFLPQPTCFRKTAFTFAEFFSPHSTCSRKAAFTLAEVLITLGIIGVVAALTLPAVINNTHNKEIQEGIKKAYSTLSQAILLYQKDTGEEVTSMTFNKTDSMKKAIMPYFSGALNCGKGTEETACVFSGKVHYRTYNKKSNVAGAYLDDGQYIVSDGMMYFFENMTNGIGVFISVDVNGFNKKPNQWGRDLFTFELTKNGKLLPMGAEGTYYNKDTYCSLSSSSSVNGIACTNKALYDENFWKGKNN